MGNGLVVPVMVMGELAAGTGDYKTETPPPAADELPVRQDEAS